MARADGWKYIISCHTLDSGQGGCKAATAFLRENTREHIPKGVETF